MMQHVRLEPGPDDPEARTLTTRPAILLRLDIYPRLMIANLAPPIFRNSTSHISKQHLPYLETASVISRNSTSHISKFLSSHPPHSPSHISKQHLPYLETFAPLPPQHSTSHISKQHLPYLEMYVPPPPPNTAPPISRKCSWSILKCFEARKCFWDSVPCFELTLFDRYTIGY